MRILFVHEKCGWFGGVEQNVAVTVRGLRARGHRCFLAWGEATERDAAGYRALFDGDAACRELGPGGAPFAALARRAAPDVIYLHKLRDSAFLRPWLGRVRTVRMVHDHDLCCPRRHKYYALCPRICRHRLDLRCWLDAAFVARESAGALGLRWVDINARRREMARNRDLDRLLVGSRFMRDELLANDFPAAKVHILPPAVPAASEPSAPPAAEPVVLYVGQLIRGKGVDLLLEAMARLRRPFRAVIVGDGNARAALERRTAALRLDGFVRFVGWVPPGELAAYYRAARMVAVPSRWPEPFGMIGLEAMQHARPVAAFAVGGIPDWLEHGVTGLLTPEADAAALARALDRLLADRALATTLGRNGRARVLERYGFGAYLAALENHLGGGAGG